MIVPALADATDGIEEYLTYVTPFRVDDATAMDGRLELATTDTGFRWLVAEDEKLHATWQRLDAGAGPGAEAVLARFGGRTDNS